MQIDQAPGRDLWAGQRRHPNPTLEDRLIARLLARWLDEELGRGMEAAVSEAHAARARQLTGERSRRRLAHKIDKLVDRVENPRPPSLIRHVPPCPQQVRDAMSLILSIRSRLLSGEPLAPQGVARLGTLISDPRGPCYLPSGPDALTVALQDSWELLHAGMTPS